MDEGILSKSINAFCKTQKLFKYLCHLENFVFCESNVSLYFIVLARITIKYLKKMEQFWHRESEVNANAHIPGVRQSLGKSRKSSNNSSYNGKR